MPTINLTDLAIQRLKADTQTRYFDENLPGFGILVGKHTKTFFVIKGKARKLVTLGRYPDLALKASRSLAKAELSKDLNTTGNDAPESILAFLDESKGRIESRTHSQYTHYLNFFEFKGDLAEITRPDIKKKLIELHDRPTAQNMAFASLRVFFNWCLRNEYLDKHPLLGMLPPNKLKSRERVLTDSELCAIWNATPPNVGSVGTRKFNRIVRVLMLTGQRRMEIANLQPELVTELLTFPDTKNKLTHAIPITPLVREHLEVPFKFNDWSGCKSRLNKRCGVKDWVLHDLRRTFSTNCAKLGIDMHVTERILNHQSGSLSGIVRTYNRYSYLPEMQEALLTHEAFVIKLITAQSNNPEPRVALHLGEHRENVPEQKAVASSDHSLDTTHHAGRES